MKEYGYLSELMRHISPVDLTLKWTRTSEDLFQTEFVKSSCYVVMTVCPPTPPPPRPRSRKRPLDIEQKERVRPGG